MCLLTIGALIFIKAISLQRQARKHIKTGKKLTIFDKILLNREPPPDEYLTDEGKVISEEVRFYAYLEICIFVGWILLDYLS